MQNPYAELGVAENATDDQIGERYRALALEFHPDLAGGDDERFKHLTSAYNELKTREARSRTDDRLLEERRQRAEAEERFRQAVASFRATPKEGVRRSAQAPWSQASRASNAIALKRRPVPTPFSDIGSSIARYRPPSEAAWWALAAVAADILWATRRR
jgi:DnaJ-class molecular chaperone